MEDDNNRIIMLKTNEKSKLGFLTKIGVLRHDLVSCSLSSIKDFSIEYQHLHVLSSEKPKINDWYLVELYDSRHDSRGFFLEQIKSIDGVFVNKGSINTARHIDNCKLIMRTTANLIGSCGKIDELTDSFILTYINEFRNGRVITHFDKETHIL